ncbi:MAG: hypothetical protein IT373_26835 [Polyangiaceae bacterium]|nr:hypothetical protein [Polyangiaceae bacterium]
MSPSRTGIFLGLGAWLAVASVALVAACTSPERAFGTGTGGSGGGGGGGASATGGGGTGGGPECAVPADCEDPNPCTLDVCSVGSCVHGPVADGPAPEQVVGDCQAVSCTGGVPSSQADDGDVPDDSNDCTADSCSGGTVVLTNLPASTPCGDPATLFCDGNGNCAGCANASQCGAPLACQDRTCTSGQCGLADKPNGTGCGDGVYCNGLDSCVAGACTAHSGDPCAANLGDADTDCSESCDEGAQSCTANDPTGAACDDATYCNGADSCNAGSCASHQGNPCPGPDGDANCAESCSELADSCSSADPNGSACANGGSCSAGACKYPIGAACTTAADCASTFCADGFCCSTACSGVCNACDGSGLDPVGTCSPLDCSTICAPGKVCNGSGSCVNGSPC